MSLTHNVEKCHQIQTGNKYFENMEKRKYLGTTLTKIACAVNQNYVH